MFTLKDIVSKNSATHLEDSAAIKSALTALKYYDDTLTGLHAYGDKSLFESIKNFQKDNLLKVDGIIKPDGPTQSTIKQRLAENKEAESAFNIFWNRRRDMVEANTIDADKYFHCLANYEATEQGWDRSATDLSTMREVYGLLKGDELSDIREDLRANKHGRSSAKSKKYNSAKEACAIYRPRGLDEKY